MLMIHTVFVRSSYATSVTSSFAGVRLFALNASLPSETA